MKKILGILFITLCTIFLARYIIVGQAVYGDAIYYWAYTRSIYFDRDIELTNELQHHYSPIGNNIPEKKRELEPINNVLQHHLPIGPSLSWLPFFALADLFTVFIQSLGFSMLRFGYSDVYQIAVGIGNILFIIIGIFYAMKFVNKYFSQKSAVIATITVLLGTNLIYYGSLDVINSHPPSFILSSIFFYLWVNTSKKRKHYEWAVLGIIIGALATIRTQEVLFSLLILYDLLQESANSIRTGKLHQIKSPTIHGLIVAGGFIIGFLPQLLVWRSAFGNLWESPYLYGDSPFSFINPQILGVLLDPKVGLLFYTPLVAVSVVGLYFIREKDQKLSLILILFFLLQFYMISAWRGWHQGASYSIRMLISCMPIFILGTAAIIEKLQKVLINKTIIVLSILFAVHNFMMILIFQLLIQDPTFDGNNITQSESIKRVREVIKNVSTF